MYKFVRVVNMHTQDKMFRCTFTTSAQLFIKFETEAKKKAIDHHINVTLQTVEGCQN